MSYKMTEIERCTATGGFSSCYSSMSSSPHASQGYSTGSVSTTTTTHTRFDTTTPTTTPTMMTTPSITNIYNPILFVSPSRGGILQSSGFLDLKSLIALSRTSKEHAIDESSVILLIENELSRNHGATTFHEAMNYYWRAHAWHRMKNWLERESSSMVPDADTLVRAGHFEVALAKMLRAFPKSQHLKALHMVNEYGYTVLHTAARASNCDSIKLIMALYTDSAHRQALHALSDVQHTVSYDKDPGFQRSELLDLRDYGGYAVLHYAHQSWNLDTIRYILELHTESQLLNVLAMQDRKQKTILHYAAYAYCHQAVELFLLLLHSCPTSQYAQLLSMRDNDGNTVLHCAIPWNSFETIRHMIELSPESQRLTIVEMTGASGDTVLHCTALWGHYEATKYIFELYPESQRLNVARMVNDNGESVFHRAACSNNPRIIDYLLGLCTESQQRSEILHTADNRGRTVLYCAANTRRHIREAITNKLSPKSWGPSSDHTETEHPHNPLKRTLHFPEDAGSGSRTQVQNKRQKKTHTDQQ